MKQHMERYMQSGQYALDGAALVWVSRDSKGWYFTFSQTSSEKIRLEPLGAGRWGYTLAGKQQRVQLIKPEPEQA